MLSDIVVWVSKVSCSLISGSNVIFKFYPPYATYPSVLCDINISLCLLAKHIMNKPPILQNFANGDKRKRSGDQGQPTRIRSASTGRDKKSGTILSSMTLLLSAIQGV